MPKYQVYFFYRDTEIDESVDLQSPDSWDGQGLVEIETDLPFGDSEGSIEDELKEVSRTIGLKEGHKVVSLFKIEEEVNIEESPFFKSEVENA